MVRHAFPWFGLGLSMSVAAYCFLVATGVA
jgi:hypothetical protein